ncbi:hypothetical protein QR680_007246 [Steinernema hermaphroditum]|uniref:Uncharacterized protein n=1 Tax=Steinernema hermaphroditum TaxID=289476 RepID=A0AA39I0F6_9BILA|nr:hypothetical protein QR680_007246 [Steinernema hermaphroditum]
MEIRRRPTPAPRPSLLTVKTKRPPPPVPQKPPGLHHRVKMIRAMNFGVAAEEEDSCAEDEEAAGEQARTKALCVYFGRRPGLSRLFTAVIDGAVAWELRPRFASDARGNSKIAPWWIPTVRTS